MQAEAIGSKATIEEYFTHMRQPKSESFLDRYVADPTLKEHIRQTEAGFPGYGIDVHQMVAEGDTVAVRGTVFGTHTGTYAGIAPTGRHVRQELMVFYRVQNGRIVNFWLQIDLPALLSQLTA